MTIRFIESLAELPGVRMPADQRCPVCDLRVDAGTWAVEAVDGQLVDSPDCYNAISHQDGHEFLESDEDDDE